MPQRGEDAEKSRQEVAADPNGANSPLSGSQCLEELSFVHSSIPPAPAPTPTSSNSPCSEYFSSNEDSDIQYNSIEDHEDEEDEDATEKLEELEELLRLQIDVQRICRQAVTGLGHLPSLQNASGRAFSGEPWPSYESSASPLPAAELINCEFVQEAHDHLDAALSNVLGHEVSTIVTAEVEGSDQPTSVRRRRRGQALIHYEEGEEDENEDDFDEYTETDLSETDCSVVGSDLGSNGRDLTDEDDDSDEEDDGLLNQFDSLNWERTTKLIKGAHLLREQVVRQMCCPNYQPQWFDAVDITQEEDMQREYGPAEEDTKRELPRLEYHGIKKPKDRSLRAWERGTFRDAITTLYGGHPQRPYRAVSSSVRASLWYLPPEIVTDPAREAAADQRVRRSAGSNGRIEDNRTDDDEDDESDDYGPDEWNTDNDQRRIRRLIDDELLCDDDDLCPGCGVPFESCRECPTCCDWASDPLTNALHFGGWTQRGSSQVNTSSAHSDSESDPETETTEWGSESDPSTDSGSSSDTDSWETCSSHFDDSTPPWPSNERRPGSRDTVNGNQRTSQELQQRHHRHILQMYCRLNPVACTTSLVSSCLAPLSSRGRCR